MDTFEIFEAVHFSGSFHDSAVPLTCFMEEPGPTLRSTSISALLWQHHTFAFPTCFDSRYDVCIRIWIKTPLGWGLVRQASLNKLMHSINGNTTLRIQLEDSVLQSVAVLQLDTLIPPSCQPAFQYSRDLLLSFRTLNTAHEYHTPTTTQFHSSSSSAKPYIRTGRRRKILLPSGNFSLRKQNAEEFAELKNSHTKLADHRLPEAHRELHGATKSAPRGWEHKA